MPATPTLASIRAAVITAIQTGMNPTTPANVLTVHGYRRFWKDYQTFRKYFTRLSPDLLNNTINGWMMNVVSDERESEEWYRFYRKHRFELEGYFGVQDVAPANPTPNTMNTFLDQIDAVRDQLLLNASVFSNTEDTTPTTKIEKLESRTLGEATVWYCMLTFECERISTIFS